MIAVEAVLVTVAITLILAGVVGYGLYKVITPKGEVKSASEYGRRWLALMVFFVTFTTLPGFFRDLDVDSFARWIVVVVFYGGVAFLAGYIYGKIFTKSVSQVDEAQ